MATTFTVKVGDPTLAAGGSPSAGPIYRSIYSKDGLMELPNDIQSPWDFFRSVHASLFAGTLLSIHKIVCEQLARRLKPIFVAVNY
jgi:hypothetical protein